MRERTIVLGLLIGALIGYMIVARVASAAAPLAYDVAIPAGGCDGVVGWRVVESWQTGGGIVFYLTCFLGPDGYPILRGG